MKRFISISFFVAIGAAIASAPSSAVAAMQPPAVLTDMVGNWSCTYTGPKGTVKSTYSITKVNDLWVQGTGDTGAYGDRPANKGIFMFGYDPKKQRYVSMGSSNMPGDYGLSTAKATPTAMTMTFVNNFPPDPTKDKTVWTFGPNSLTQDETWTQKGKAMSAKGSCTKS